MNIDIISDFLNFAESLSFTRTAADRETTQSNLSKRLRQLEIWLASDLIDRRSRPVALTQAGKDFVPVARGIVAELAAFRSNHRPWQAADGAITIAMPHSATISVFPSFKHQLSNEAIPASFSVRIANHDRVGSMLASSECDLALATSHPKVIQSPEFSALRSIEVAKERLVVVSSPELEDRKPAPLHVSDRRTYIGQIWQRCRVSIPSTVELEHDMAADIRNYCLAGEGRGVAPLSLVESDISSGRLRKLRSDPSLAYTFLLYCAPKASVQARRIWSSAASILGAVRP
ncbi:LysR family transcriptional regulator [Rhizobium sp. ERR 922]|uniref:LysR family transcriptional regulator n=1 Tax=unclassified Rhizobium TaxID=2613769 RepID=UPI00119D76BF|nr:MULTISPECIES: LysR family transcriptional regulator [unclassified Rhizobium]TWB46201.1 LysR family transcriptional regulator [Rhizobium sp. ERR 922]TWB90783.1 LysR family transcriptional regulator [Rhizobium sp. ERR 942]